MLSATPGPPPTVSLCSSTVPTLSCSHTKACPVSASVCLCRLQWTHRLLSRRASTGPHLVPEDPRPPAAPPCLSPHTWLPTFCCWADHGTDTKHGRADVSPGACLLGPGFPTKAQPALDRGALRPARQTDADAGLASILSVQLSPSSCLEAQGRTAWTGCDAGGKARVLLPRHPPDPQEGTHSLTPTKSWPSPQLLPRPGDRDSRRLTCGNRVQRGLEAGSSPPLAEASRALPAPGKQTHLQVGNLQWRPILGPVPATAAPQKPTVCGPLPQEGRCCPASLASGSLRRNTGFRYILTLAGAPRGPGEALLRPGRCPSPADRTAGLPQQQM